MTNALVMAHTIGRVGMSTKENGRYETHSIFQYLKNFLLPIVPDIFLLLPLSCCSMVVWMDMVVSVGPIVIHT